MRSISNWYKTKIKYTDNNGVLQVLDGDQTALTVNTWTTVSEEWIAPADIDENQPVEIAIFFKYGGDPGNFYYDDFSFNDGKVIGDGGG